MAGYVYCDCCGYDCMDGPMCLECEEAGCESGDDCLVPGDELARRHAAMFTIEEEDV